MPNIPSQFKKLAESAELYDQSEKIGAKFGLMIDQIGEMDAEIRGVLLGIFKPSDFSAHIAQRLEIDKGKAQAITDEVNKEVFQAIKKTLQSQTSPEIPDNSALEKIGGFDIEKNEPENEDKSQSLKAMADENIEGSGDILEGIENPQPGRKASFPKPEELHTEGLVDHLLTTSTAIPEEKVSVNIPVVPAKPVPTLKPVSRGPDPYHEPIE